jgi:type VI secretion system secreted protein Hcp
MTLAAAAAAIAVDANAAAFAKFGDIKGETTDDKHKDHSDVIAWSWGVRSGSKKPGCGSDLVVTKRVDLATPKLVQSAAQGTILPTAVLKVGRETEGSEDFLVITMQNVSVASVQPSGTFGGDPLEMVYLSYSTATIGYKPQQADGQLGAEVIASVLGCPS